MAESALQRAFSDAARLEIAAQSVVNSKAADIGRELATSSNWISTATSKLGYEVEQYKHYRDWVYVCVNAIARRCAGQPIRLARPKKLARRGLKAFDAGFGSKNFVESLEPIESHLFLDTIHAPNSVMVGQSLIVSTIASLEITGESHWWMTTPDDNGTPQIWPLPSHWIRPADAIRSAWILRPWYSSVEFTVPGESIGYFNLPDPSNPFISRSPLASQNHAVNADEAIQLAQDVAFRNGVHPKLAVMIGDPLGTREDNRLISSPPTLDKDQRGVIINAIMNRYGGPHNAWTPIICDALIRDIKPISNTPSEMDFLNSGKSTKSRIFQAYGINPLIVGEIEGANRAQAVVAEQSFCSNVINPLLELLSQCLTRWVVPAFAGDEGLVAWFEPCRANDPEMSIKEWQLGLQFGTVTPNEYRQFLGLPAIAGGDVPRIPANMLAMGD